LAGGATPGKRAATAAAGIGRGIAEKVSRDSDDDEQDMSMRRDGSIHHIGDLRDATLIVLLVGCKPYRVYISWF